MTAALLLIDVDQFKQRQRRATATWPATCCCARLRAPPATRCASPTCSARFGGEEFVVFLPHTDPLGALDVAERIRDQVAARWRCAWQRPARCGTTVSVGVVVAARRSTSRSTR